MTQSTVGIDATKQYQKILDQFEAMDLWDCTTYPRNKTLAALYYDLFWDHPDHPSAAQWQREYDYHWNEYLKGNDTYVPF